MKNIKRSSSASTLLKLVLLFIFCWSFPMKGWGQLDSVHWIPPMHGRTNIGYHYLYLSTPEATPFSVNIFDGSGIQLGNVNISNSSPQRYTIGYGEYTPVTIDPDQLNNIMNSKGLKLIATKKFYCDLRTIEPPHGASLTAKGRSALGTIFRVGHLYADDGAHFVGVMATENNTAVTFSNFRPGVYLQEGSGNNNSFLANTPITITLDAGQCYVISMYEHNYQFSFPNGLFGLLVSASKPIAVNCGSWIGSTVNGGGGDIGIDQIAPLEKSGTEYVLMRGQGPYQIEEPLIVGHYDSTLIYINDNPIPDTLNAGRYMRVFDSNYWDANGVLFGNIRIKTSKPVFMYQSIGGGGAQNAALNFVPPLSCQIGNDINNIPFVSEIGSNDNFLGGIQILAPSNAQVHLFRNNVEVTLPSPKQVRGNPDYLTYSYGGLPNNTVSHVRVLSDGPVQVSIARRNGDIGWGGYYSGFDKVLVPEVAISASAQCFDTLFLHKKYINGGVTWYLNNQLLNPPLDSVLAITQPGDYMVIGRYNTFCDEEVFDTAYYTVPDNFFSAAGDVIPINCSATQQQGQITIQVTGNGAYQYSLDNGFFGPSPVFDVSSPGQHTVRIQDQQGCIKTFAVDVAVNESTALTATICPGETVEVNGTIYSQSNPTGTEYISQPGDICDSIVNVTLIPLPQAIGTVNGTRCKGDSLKIGAVVFNENNPSGTVTLPNASVNGCDSIVEVQLNFLSEIETHIETSSCNPADTGLAVQVLQSYLGCDSTVITTTTFRDTVFVEQFATTCNPASVGELVQYIGCDSLIKTFVSLDISGVSIQYDTVFTCNASEVGNDTIFVNGQNWCDGAIFKTTKLIQTVFIEKETLVCRLSEVGRDTFYYGCDSVLHVDNIYDSTAVARHNRSEWVCEISEVGIDTFWHLTDAGCDSLDILERKQAPTSSSTLYRSTCNPDHADTSVAILHNQYGCDSIVTTVTTFEPSSIPMTHLIRYTCHPDEAGEITLTYKTPEDCDSLVVVTTYYDASLVPMLEAEATDEACPGSGNGSILLSTFNGTPPFSYSLAGFGPLQGDFVTTLPPGDYQLFVVDSLGCADSTEVTVVAAQEVTVALSPTINMTMCDSIRLIPEISLPGLVDSVVWLPNNGLDCPDCLSPIAFPKVDTKYKLNVYYGDGCIAVAVQYIKVNTCGNWYAPNVFCPSSSDPDNFRFTIYSDENITKINLLRIYDRWGALVYQETDFDPNEPNLGWNGSHNSSKYNMGVYTWYAELEYANGYIEKAKGNVTVVR